MELESKKIQVNRTDIKLNTKKVPSSGRGLTSRSLASATVQRPSGRGSFKTVDNENKTENPIKKTTKIPITLMGFNPHLASGILEPS